MKVNMQRKEVAVLRREYMLVDRPTLENVTATNEEINMLIDKYNFTIREAQIMWLLRAKLPTDLSLIVSARTHVYNMRNKLKPHNMEIQNLWRGVYQLSVVGD